MTRIISLDEIKAILPSISLLPIIEDGFRQYSLGNCVVPPVGELLMDKGEVHIKYGYIKQRNYYVIKIASGFFDNPKIGLPTSNGMMLLFSQESGQPVAILLDEGHLTDVRTAVAGAIAAKYLAPASTQKIGIVGTGIQAKLQLSYLRSVTPCRDVVVWGRGESQLNDYQKAMQAEGFNVETTRYIEQVQTQCQLIVTTTPSTEPILKSEFLKPGIHITAVGSDTPHKQELETEILAQADLVVADSISQCLLRGEIFKAISADDLSEDKVVELGQLISGNARGRVSDEQITVTDLTGVAVQDIQIATEVYVQILLSNGLTP